MTDDPRRRTPRTDAVLADPDVAAAVLRLGRGRVKSVVVEVLESCRRGEVPPDDVVPCVLRALPDAATTLRPVINATGVVVHTNLGRAPLSEAAVEAVRRAAGATDVELDLSSGLRGPRGRGALAALAAAVPRAGGVHVVNNGAAALSLVACALAGTERDQGREVVIARGELVEIGDGFRIPELLESLGVRLREVGTTNRVRVTDYEAAIGASTAFVLKVHPSNFRVEGFTSAVSVAELAGLGVPLVVDIGSGLLAPHPRLPDEPDASSVLRDGADLVTASGDKLLGGPQCGLLLGDAGLVQRLRRHPFARALRVDKLTLAALEATLTGPVPPVPSVLAARPDELLARAARLATRIGDLASAAPSQGRVGGGGAPGVLLPSAAVVLPPALAAPLRLGDPAVVGHVHDDRLHLDLLTVPGELDEALAAAVLRAAGRSEG
ncbi:L-seryl-tRNA(Sec) selenium transferase [Nocardioides sp. YIM 152315]|uniref:L-seryl-tRNA(Sec) selenium transferase n=1 Tax=Nocardioides sp. YIM 152315 TaxID=3031760 RepID=UPI0023DC0621|nr:L-seryl-tRNA(Sec) selenium transferase [Nocardioides sp. YIM 152315]MDF1606254.1 L-seryl-tRNA(Sec) selenium transferase [Nocardioides sp. YIM 152315]